MNAQAIERVATALAEAWKGFKTIPLPPVADAPASRLEAYAVQDRMAEIIGERCIGWKVGAAAKAVQDLEGLDGPLPGRILASRVFASPARVPAGFAGYKVECEFGFRLTADVPARSRAYTRTEIAPLLVFHPGIELAGSRYEPDSGDRKPTTFDGIADNGTGGGFVFGRGMEDWQRAPFETLPIEARIDGGPAIEVYTGVYRCDAADVAVATINDLGQRGIGLAAGDYLSAGSLTMPTPIQRGRACAPALATCKS